MRKRPPSGHRRLPAAGRHGVVGIVGLVGIVLACDAEAARNPGGRIVLVGETEPLERRAGC